MYVHWDANVDHQCEDQICTLIFVSFETDEYVFSSTHHSKDHLMRLALLLLPKRQWRQSLCYFVDLQLLMYN